MAGLLTRFSGSVVRQTGLDTPAFPPARAAPAPARYHRTGEPWPLYSALDEPTAWAEWRAATGGAIDPSDERRRLWTLAVADLPVLDLRRPEVRERLGVDLEELVGERGRAQALANEALRAGAAGLVAPSAAHRGGWSLVVFPVGFDRVTVTASRAARPRPPVSDRVQPG